MDLLDLILAKLAASTRWKHEPTLRCKYINQEFPPTYEPAPGKISSVLAGRTAGGLVEAAATAAPTSISPFCLHCCCSSTGTKNVAVVSEQCV